MHIIELLVYRFLQEVQGGRYRASPDLLKRFGESTVAHLQKQFERTPDDKFTLRMSNIGQPLCILQMEKEHGRGAGDAQRFLLGDIFEDVMMFVLHAAGLNIIAEQQQVALEIGGIKLKGTLDLVTDIGDGPEVYDIKSASEYSFKHKFNQSIEDFIKTDTFGYTNQLLAYAYAVGARAGGFIVGNKSSGEMKVYAFPKEQAHLQQTALLEMERNIRNIDSPFQRQFTDVNEKFKKKLTGNRMLGTTCGFCEYKFKCWPGVQALPQVMSEARNPKTVFYTHLAELKKPEPLKALTIEEIYEEPLD